MHKTLAYLPTKEPDWYLLYADCHHAAGVMSTTLAVLHPKGALAGARRRTCWAPSSRCAATAWR